MRAPRAAIAWLVAALAVAAAAPASASAHAVLESTSPARGTTVDREPAQVEFRFDEPVESAFGAVRVFGPGGDRVDSGAVLHPHGQRSVGVRLRSGLPRGSYTATYRVISADSHPVSGGFVFSIGSGGPAPARSVADLTRTQQAGTATEIAFGIDRGVQYAAIAAVVGGLAFVVLVWLPALAGVAGAGADWLAASQAFAGRLRTIVATGVVAGAVSCALGIVMQAATASGTSVWSAFQPDLVREVLHTRFGAIWGLRLVDWALLGAALVAVARVAGGVALRPVSVGADGLAPPRAGAVAAAAIGVPLAFLVVSPALAGHAASQSPSWLLIPADSVHVGAMSLWAGGLTLLVFALPAATRALATPGERTRLLAAVLLRFSPVALVAVAAIVATGTTQAIVHVGALHNLVDTAFGRAVSIKVVLLIALIALGAWNRRRALPALRRAADGAEPPGAVGRGLRRSLRAEVALIVAVLGTTAALVSYAPPSTAAPSGPFAVTRTIGPIELQATIDPARTGANSVHLYLLEARTGAPYRATKELRASVALPSEAIGPLPLAVRRAGPGHYIAGPALLAVPGRWDLRIQARVSAFDQYTADFRVPVR